MKYLVGLGVLVAVAAVAAYLLLVPGQDTPAPAEAPAPAAPPDAAEEEVAQDTPQDDPAPAPRDEDAVLEDMAADAREDLPADVGDGLRLTDAVFLPRMRIMEFTYVATAPEAGASPDRMRAQIDTRAGEICRARRDMVEMGVTLRNSFVDDVGAVLQRVYLLPEDCGQFD